MKQFIAVCVGYRYAVVPAELTNGICLRKTEMFVTHNSVTYPLYKGETFEASQMIDAILDRDDVTECDIPRRKEEQEERLFEVTFARTGVAYIRARPCDLLDKANALCEGDISWTDDWNVTDTQEAFDNE